ncbi:exported hypothetical protein [uncultured Paludibacter sp.]|uniref:Fibronectin type-III domain-containing protein n=1 Tax=uncultured Paludibacter sp. TaxID=497635 RepID=A0A653AK00_9BACT|nr:exported hypothetical protein [uncultured Paludibacter sp.]
MKKLLPMFVLVFLGVQLWAQPSTSAPTPPARTQGKVISILSDAYTNVAGTDFNPWWGQTTVVSTQQFVSGDNVLVYSNLNYQGTQINGTLNALPMTHLHIDIWTADETSFQITPISSNPTMEFLVACSPLNLNTWNSFDIPLSSFTGVDFSKIFQFKVVGSGGKTVYIDNLYFYDSSVTVDTEAPTAFTATTGTIASDAITLLLNATDNSGAVDYTITYGTTTIQTQGGVSGQQMSYTINGLTPSTAYTFQVSVKDPTGNGAANNPITVNATTASALPAAPVPTVDASKVISVYSNSYTNQPANFYPNWGQSTVASEVDLGGNNAMKYSNFNYQGIELGSHVDASAMNMLHIDIYPTTETSVRITPISPGNELPTSLGTLVADQWNSFDVPLSTYSNVDFSDLFQFKLDGGTGGVFYMDNLYLYNNVGTNNGIISVSAKQIKCYPNPVVNTLFVETNEEIKEILIQNITGQTIKRINTYSNKGIDVQDIKTGNYFLVIKGSDNQQYVAKFIKM